MLHPGAKRPEGRPEEDTTLRIEDREVRVRRWRNLHFREAPQTLIDVVRVDDPAYKRPLLIGTTARELTTDEVRTAYGHRWPVETNFFVAQGTCAMEMPRAWSETGVERRISLALLAGSLLKAIAAACPPLPMGPWDLLELARYVVLNPVRARMVRNPAEWPWSSYRATAGLCEAPCWLTTDWLLSAFSARRSEAVARYAAFVAAGKQQPGPWEKLKNQIFLGSEVFVTRLQRHLNTADARLQL